MYCHNCGSTCTTGYYLCTCRFALILHWILCSPRSGLVPSDRPQPTGYVTDPYSSLFMLVQNSRDVYLMYIAVIIAAIVCILRSFEHAIKYQD